jgi:hypothetical protein
MVLPPLSCIQPPAGGAQFVGRSGRGVIATGPLGDGGLVQHPGPLNPLAAFSRAGLGVNPAAERLAAADANPILGFAHFLDFIFVLGFCFLKPD